MIISPLAVHLASGAQRDEEILRGFLIGCIKQHAEIGVGIAAYVHCILAGRVMKTIMILLIKLVVNREELFFSLERSTYATSKNTKEDNSLIIVTNKRVKNAKII